MTLSLDGLVLPPDMVWADEYDWTPTEQSQTYALNGALVIETAQKLTGRPITLTSEQSSGWIKKQILDQLYAKLALTTSLVLTVQSGETFDVTWRSDPKPIDMKPIKFNRIMTQDSRYFGSIKLIEVTAGTGGSGSGSGSGSGGGSSSGSTVDLTYQHIQSSPSTTWIINHNLGKYPSIQLLSVGGIEFLAEITHNSINQSTVTLTSPLAGIAQCN